MNWHDLALLFIGLCIGVNGSAAYRAVRRLIESRRM